PKNGSYPCMAAPREVHRDGSDCDGAIATDASHVWKLDAQARMALRIDVKSACSARAFRHCLYRHRASDSAPSAVPIAVRLVEEPASERGRSGGGALRDDDARRSRHRSCCGDDDGGPVDVRLVDDRQGREHSARNNQRHIVLVDGDTSGWTLDSSANLNAVQADLAREAIDDVLDDACQRAHADRGLRRYRDGGERIDQPRRTP